MRLSIQTRLLVLSLLSVLIVALATMALAYREAEHEVDELIDGQLVQYARIMLALAHTSDDDEVEAPHIDGHRYASRVIFQIWERDNDGDTLLLRSPESPSVWPAGVARQGYSDMRLGDAAWRCFAASDPESKRHVLAALDLHVRDELTKDIAWGNVRPYLYGLPVLAFLLIWGIRGGLAPLYRLEQALAQRSPERLDRLPENLATRELRPLIGTMNGLFDRVKGVLDNERRFTSDAAHELRTPLAALKVQLQVAQRTPDDQEWHAAIGKALKVTDRMTHLVGQLLALARLENAQSAPAMDTVPLSGLAQDCFDDAQAQAVGRILESSLQPDLETHGNADLLRALIRNLLDNALRYTPAGGHIHLSLEEDGAPSGATETSRPPLVWGSVSRSRRQSGRPAGTSTEAP
jgi:two-component system sensor histidine kinase QseC